MQPLEVVHKCVLWPCVWGRDRGLEKELPMKFLLVFVLYPRLSLPNTAELEYFGRGGARKIISHRDYSISRSRDRHQLQANTAGSFPFHDALPTLNAYTAVGGATSKRIHKVRFELLS